MWKWFIIVLAKLSTDLINEADLTNLLAKNYFYDLNFLNMLASKMYENKLIKFELVVLSFALGIDENIIT